MTLPRIVMASLALLTFPARADFQITQTTRITGGTVLQLAGLMGAKLSAPVKGKVFVKGDRMAHVSDLSVEIVDLNAETVTTLNRSQKTYQVTPFDRLEASEKTPDGLQVEIANGPDARVLQGERTREKILTVSLKTKDPRTGQPISTKIESDMFITSHIKGAQELRNFYKRMEGVAWAPRGMLGMNREMAQALANVYRSTRQLDGLPLLTSLTVSGSLPGVSEVPSKDALMKMTVEVVDWSNAPVDESVFQIPLGYKRAVVKR